jgi:hypothetical protein
MHSRSPNHDFPITPAAGQFWLAPQAVCLTLIPPLATMLALAICSLLLLRLLLLLPCLTPLLLPLPPLTCRLAFSSVLHNQWHDMIVLSSLSCPWLLSPVLTPMTKLLLHPLQLSTFNFVIDAPPKIWRPKPVDLCIPLDHSKDTVDNVFEFEQRSKASCHQPEPFSLSGLQSGTRLC